MIKEKPVVIGSTFLANSILKKAKEKNMKINCIKLYNLIYLIYLDYYNKTGTKLFSEQFSYSYMGPILPSVYFKFNCYGNEEIKSYSFDAKGNIYIIENNILNAIINYNLDLYGCLCSEAIIKESSKRNLPVEDIRLSDKEKVMLRSSKNE